MATQRKQKPTPGPWTLSDDAVRRVIVGAGAKPRTVCIIENWTTEPDAHLISAAPDLLAVAKTYAMHAVDCHVRPFGGGLRATWAGDDYKVCTCALGDAIRKAEGRDVR